MIIGLNLADGRRCTIEGNDFVASIEGEPGDGKTKLGYPTGAFFQGFEILLKGSDCWNSDYEHVKSRFNQMYCDWIASQPGAGVRPVVGEGKGYSFADCPKCGKGITWHRLVIRGLRFCAHCLTSRPGAPKGYEFVAWRDPVYGEWFLAETTGAPMQRTVDAPWHGGKRWILRRVEEAKACPKCGGPREAGDIINLPCGKCYSARPPAKPGFEYTGEWDRPKKGEYYLGQPDNEPVQCGGDWGAQSGIDQGRRWILKKVAEVGQGSDQIMVGPDGSLLGWFDHETGHFHTPPVGPKSDGCWNCDKASIRNGGLRLDDCVEKESDGKTITCKAWEPVKAKGRVYNHCDYSDMLHAAIMKALHELGVPGEGYPAPVANAVSILQAAAEALEPPA